MTKTIMRIFLCSSCKALNSSAFVSQQASIFNSNVPIQSCCCQNLGKARKMSDRQLKKTRRFSYKSSYNLQSGPERNTDKKTQPFRSPLAFSSTMDDVCCPDSGTKQAPSCVRRKGTRRDGEMNKGK